MAAPSATNGDAAAAAEASLDAIKPPAGVVLPPHEVRAVLEKTAGYVARNGAIFEDRVRSKESRNAKFGFLNPDDPFHAFYQWRLSEIKAGRGTSVAAGRVGEAASATPVPEKPAGPPKPPDFEFSARMPRISQKDLDVIRLTALFVAKNGRQFMTQLAQRETGNPQFQFLIPNHTFHNFFQHVIDQYTILLRAGGLDGEGGKLQEERVAALEKSAQDKFHVLERAKQRAEYAKFQEEEKRQREEQEQERKAEFARIDWGDFVVVETINFTDADEQANLPPPTSLSELQYASLEDRNKASISATMRIEEAMPGEEDYSMPVHTRSAYGGYGASGPQQPQQEDLPAQAQPQAPQHPPPQPDRVGPGAMKIRENYVPRAAQRATERQGGQMALCPNCKQQIPMNELEEHMRIELLDPSWKEQKAKADTRYAVANMSQADVANNLKRLASQRSDVFDPITGQAISEEELARRKRAAIHSYDGNPDGKGQGQAQTGQMQSYNVEEQIRAIHQKFGDKK